MVIEVKQNGKFVKIPYITADVPVSEAPIDGKQYARQDATWSEIVIPEVDLTEVEANIAANTQAIAANTADIATLNSTVSNLPTAGSIVVTTDPRLTAATTTKAGLMTAADKVQLDSTLTATEIENKVNAAVSSVYRVKGNVATVSNLPTSNVAIGDVYNITDSGANYVAVNNNPVEWDKLSETVDLAPYMQTSTANNTFVKKSGDTMTGTLNVTGDGKIAISNGTINSYANEGSTGKFCRFIKGDNVEAGSFGWDADGMYIYNFNRKNKLYYKNNGDLTFENVHVALQDDSKSITERYTAGSTERAVFLSHGINIIPPTTTTNKGLRYYTNDGNTMIGAIGATLGGTTLNKLYMGWGTNPYDSANNLSVSSTALSYKNNKVWHAGNDGAGSGLDADTVDGIQSNRIIYGGNASGTTNFGEDLTSFNNITKSGFYRCNANPKLKLLVSIHHPDSPSEHILQIGTTYEQDVTKNSLNYRIKTRDGGWSNPRTIVDTSTVLTQDEYNALGSTVNSDGKIYFIKE